MVHNAYFSTVIKQMWNFSGGKMLLVGNPSTDLLVWLKSWKVYHLQPLHAQSDVKDIQSNVSNSEIIITEFENLRFLSYFAFSHILFINVSPKIRNKRYTSFHFVRNWRFVVVQQSLQAFILSRECESVEPQDLLQGYKRFLR